MLCRNCGAEYNKKELQCPYCHSENYEAVARHKKKILHEYDREADRIRQEAENYPKAEAKRRTRIILMVLGVLAVLGLIGTGLYILFSRLSADASYKTGQKHKENLEEYYQAEDYEGMSGYLDKNELYKPVYRKYMEVALVYDYFLRMEEARRELEECADIVYDTPETQEKFFRHRAETYLECSARALSRTREGMEDSDFAGNEDVLEAMYRQGRESLKEQGFSEEEIDLLEETAGYDEGKADEEQSLQEEWESLIDKLGEKYL